MNGVPCGREHANVILLDFVVLDNTKHVIHALLGVVRRTIEARYVSTFTSQRCKNDTKVLTFLTEFKGIMMHGIINLCEELCPETHSRMSIIVDNRYFKQTMALISGNKSMLKRTCPSYLQMVKTEGVVHLLLG